MYIVTWIVKYEHDVRSAVTSSCTSGRQIYDALLTHNKQLLSLKLSYQDGSTIEEWRR